MQIFPKEIVLMVTEMLLERDIIFSIKNRCDLHLLVTDQLNKNIPVYRWYNYKHSFSRELVIELFKAFSFTPNEEKIVFDPFCGAGTTLLAAKEYGLASIGVDVMPFSVFVSEAKTTNYDVCILRSRYQKLRQHLKVYAGKSNGFDNKRKMLSPYFSKGILNWLLYIYSWIVHQSDRNVKLFFMTGLFSILEEISQMKRDGGFLRHCSREINVVTAQEKLIYQIDIMLEDIENNPIVGPVPKINTCDIRQVKTNELLIGNNSIDAIITSPPYPNRHDYTRIYGLESILGFSKKAKDIKLIRYRTLRSHVEAKESHVNENYICPMKLKKIIAQLERNRKDLPNEEIIPMLQGYFEDMFSVFEYLHQLLKDNGFFALVVCDVRYGGIVVPVGDILNKCAKTIGFTLMKKIIARSKNNSAQQMKKFGKHSIMEYIFIWKKK